MIVHAILQPLLDSLAALLGAVPEVVMPAWMSGGRSDMGSLRQLAWSAGGQVSLVNTWVPVSEVVNTVPLILNATLAVMGIKFSLKVYSLVRGGGD